LKERGILFPSAALSPCEGPRREKECPEDRAEGKRRLERGVLQDCS
jgi:hypothetical protein